MRTAPVVIVPLASKERLPRPLRPARQGLDRPQRGPVAGAVLVGRHRDGRPADPADRGRRGARGLLLRHPRRAPGRPSATRSASPTTTQPVGAITVGHRVDRRRRGGVAGASRASYESGPPRSLGHYGRPMTPPPVDGRVVSALQALVRIPTVSDRDPDRVDTDAFDRLLAELARQFPLLHEHLDLTRVGSHGLLLHWAGASAEKPVVLMAHLDVVPVDADAPWQHDPFGGEIHPSATGPAIWGRGTLDDKGCVAAICDGRRDPARDGAHPRPGRVAVVRVRRGGQWHRGGRGGRRAARARGHALAGARRGRRDRGRRLPRRDARRWASSASPRRAPPPSSSSPRDAAATPRPRRATAPRPASRGRSCASRRRPSPRPPPRPRWSCMRRLAPHVPLPLRPLLDPRRQGWRRWSPARCSPPAPRPRP